MNARYLIAAPLVAAVVLFLASMAVHMSAPAGEPVKEFADASAVAAVIRDKTQGNGMYFAPQGVFAAVSLKEDGSSPFDFATMLIGDFLFCLVVAVFLSVLLLWTRIQSALGGAAFFGVAALAAGFANIAPEWNWYGFSFAHTAFQFADLLIGWFVAGLAVGALRGRLAPVA